MDSVQLAHLLRRTEFIARPARMTELGQASVTRANAVDNILDVTTPVALPAYLDHDIEGEGYEQYVYAIKWWFDRMVDSPKPMQERMAFFWHGHFCSSWDKVSNTTAMMQQNKLFRDSALGNFRTMTHAMAIQPAMLYYLDNLDNVKSSPNQNFARELMELFTLGVVDQNGAPNYTENDVTAAAKAWTGHGIDWDTYTYKFWPGEHDTGNKTFMGVTKNWDGPDIINHITGNPAVPGSSTAKKMVACKFLTRKLWEYLAYQNPAQSLVDQLAQVLYDNDFEIKPWVRALLLRDEFYSQAATQGLVRSPVDFVANVFFWSGYRGADLNPQWYVNNMGQLPFVPPNVAGWKTNGYWINTSLFGSRAEFAQDTAYHLRNPNYNGGAPDPHNVSKNSNGTKRTPAEAVAAVAALFGFTVADLSATSYNALLSYATAQRAAESYVNWWEPTNLLTMIMTIPEFHTA